VIGNPSYTSALSLDNTLNDARIDLKCVKSCRLWPGNKEPREEVAAVFPDVQMQVSTSTQSEQRPELSVCSLGMVRLNSAESGFDVWKKVSLRDNQEEVGALIMARQKRSKCDRDSTRAR